MEWPHCSQWGPGDPRHAPDHSPWGPGHSGSAGRNQLPRPSGFDRLRFWPQTPGPPQTARQRQPDYRGDAWSLRVPNLTWPEVSPWMCGGPSCVPPQVPRSHLHLGPMGEATVGKELGDLYKARVWQVLGLARRGPVEGLEGTWKPRGVTCAPEWGAGGKGAGGSKSPWGR